MHLSELTKLSNSDKEMAYLSFVLHLSELTKLSNEVMTKMICRVVLHLSELTKLSNDRDLFERVQKFYIFLN